MSILIERHMLARAIRGIVSGMTILGGHGMPKGAPCCREAGAPRDISMRLR